MTLVSIVMALSENDKVSDFEACLDSIVNQTFTSHETIIVSDGYIPDELQHVVEKYQSQEHLVLHFKQTEKKSGPAYAWNAGFDLAKGDYIARMDPDDIMRPERLATQLQFMKARPDIHVLGAWIEEFDNGRGDRGLFRKTPICHKKISRVSRFSNPMNHVTVMMRREVAENFKYEQFWGFVDYFFWLKLLNSGVIFHNLDRVLIDVRVGNGFLNRRRGWGYLQQEIVFLRECWKRNLLGQAAIIKYAISKLPMRIMPRWILVLAYKIIRR